MVTVMRGNLPMTTQLWREMAHFDGAAHEGSDRSFGLCNDTNVDGSLSNRTSLHCQYRYPSPRRSGPFGSRPTPLFHGVVVDFRCSCKPREKNLVLQVETTDSDANKIKHETVQNKGSQKCLNSVLSSLSQPSRRFPRASTMTSNAGLRARPLVPSPQTLLASIRSQVRLWAVQLACCATNSPVSAAKTFASSGVFTHFDRRSGSSRAAVLHSKGLTHV